MVKSTSVRRNPPRRARLAKTLDNYSEALNPILDEPAVPSCSRSEVHKMSIGSESDRYNLRRTNARIKRDKNVLDQSVSNVMRRLRRLAYNHSENFTQIKTETKPSPLKKIKIVKKKKTWNITQESNETDEDDEFKYVARNGPSISSTTSLNSTKIKKEKMNRPKYFYNDEINDNSEVHDDDIYYIDRTNYAEDASDQNIRRPLNMKIKRERGKRKIKREYDEANTINISIKKEEQDDGDEDLSLFQRMRKDDSKLNNFVSVKEENKSSIVKVPQLLKEEESQSKYIRKTNKRKKRRKSLFTRRKRPRKNKIIKKEILDIPSKTSGGVNKIIIKKEKDSFHSAVVKEETHILEESLVIKTPRKRRKSSHEKIEIKEETISEEQEIPSKRRRKSVSDHHMECKYNKFYPCRRCSKGAPIKLEEEIGPSAELDNEEGFKGFTEEEINHVEIIWNNFYRTIFVQETNDENNPSDDENVQYVDELPNYYVNQSQNYNRDPIAVNCQHQMENQSGTIKEEDISDEGVSMSYDGSNEFPGREKRVINFNDNNSFLVKEDQYAEDPNIYNAQKSAYDEELVVSANDASEYCETDYGPDEENDPNLCVDMPLLYGVVPGKEGENNYGEEEEESKPLVTDHEDTQNFGDNNSLRYPHEMVFIEQNANNVIKTKINYYNNSFEDEEKPKLEIIYQNHYESVNDNISTCHTFSEKTATLVKDVPNRPDSGSEIDSDKDEECERHSHMEKPNEGTKFHKTSANNVNGPFYEVFSSEEDEGMDIAARSETHGNNIRSSVDKQYNNWIEIGSSSESSNDSDEEGVSSPEVDYASYTKKNKNNDENEYLFVRNSFEVQGGFVPERSLPVFTTTGRMNGNANPTNVQLDPTHYREIFSGDPLACHFDNFININQRRNLPTNDETIIISDDEESVDQKKSDYGEPVRQHYSCECEDVTNDSDISENPSYIPSAKHYPEHSPVKYFYSFYQFSWPEKSVQYVSYDTNLLPNRVQIDHNYFRKLTQLRTIEHIVPSVFNKDFTSWHEDKFYVHKELIPRVEKKELIACLEYLFQMADCYISSTTKHYYMELAAMTFYYPGIHVLEAHLNFIKDVLRKIAEAEEKLRVAHCDLADLLILTPASEYKSLESSNAVYSIDCSGCGLTFVGSTKSSVRRAIQQLFNSKFFYRGELTTFCRFGGSSHLFEQDTLKVLAVTVEQHLDHRRRVEMQSLIAKGVKLVPTGDAELSNEWKTIFNMKFTSDYVYGYYWFSCIKPLLQNIKP